MTCIMKNSPVFGGLIQIVKRSLFLSNTGRNNLMQKIALFGTVFSCLDLQHFVAIFGQLSLGNKSNENCYILCSLSAILLYQNVHCDMRNGKLSCKKHSAEKHSLEKYTAHKAINKKAYSKVAVK